MPFSLKNDPAMLQQFISKVLREINRQRQIYVYMDFIIFLKQNFTLLAKF